MRRTNWTRFIDCDLILFLLFMAWVTISGHLWDFLVIFVFIIGLMAMIIKAFFLPDLIISILKWIGRKIFVRRSLC